MIKQGQAKSKHEKCSSIAYVRVLLTGYAKWKGYATQKACGSITLIVSESNLIENRNKNIIIVDTGVPAFKNQLLKKINEAEIDIKDVNYVISTHSDIDHIGNLNLFPQATFIAGNDIIKDDVFIDFFDKRYAVDENVKIITTPGHDSHSLSVIVKTKIGIVAIVGDLFEKENDWKETGTWEPWSQDPRTQAKNRLKIFKIADYIVPGHGKMFKVDKKLDLAKLDKKRLKKIQEK